MPNASVGARAVREDADAGQAVQIVRATWRDTRALVRHIRDKGSSTPANTRRDGWGATREIYLKAVSRLGTLGGSAAIEALSEVLHKGIWWAPRRAREWRTEAAAALAQIATAEAMAALEDAAARGSFGVKRIAKKYVSTVLA